MKRGLIELTTPLTHSDVDQLGDALAKVQGNILKAHGRTHSAFMMLDISNAERRGIKTWLGQFARKHVQSMQQQLNQAADFKRNAKHLGSVHEARVQDASMFGSIFLSNEGYTRLGYGGVADEFRDSSFVDGMKKSGYERLGDPPVATWQREYRDPIHVVLLLASNNLEFLRKVAEDLAGALKSLGGRIFTEYGTTDRNSSDLFEDPFRYAHGISQPRFFQHEVEEYEKTHRVPRGSGRWDTSAAPNLVLVRDPLVVGDEDALGSYVVFRKLEMDVEGFESELYKLAQALAIEGDQESAKEHVAGIVAGRFRSGAPLVSWRRGVKLKDLPVTDNFDYTADPDGLVCPFHSHVRKANPRGGGPNGLADEREHRIVRRGTNYREGPRPEDSRGMLFLSYQARIQRQFEFMQKRWLNDEDFPQSGSGSDPFSAHGSDWRPQKWRLPSQRASTGFRFGDLVHLRGGAYLFAPSIPFLMSWP